MKALGLAFAMLLMTATFAPAQNLIAYVTPDTIPRVVYVGADSHIHELRLQGTNLTPVGWIQADLSAIVTDSPPAVPAINGSSVHAYVTPDGIPRVVYVGVDSHIHELRLQKSWIQADLSAIVTNNSPAVPAINGSSVHAYVTPDGIPRVVYIGVDSHIHELRLQGTNLTPVGWIQADLSAIVTDNPPAVPAAIGSPVHAYVTPDGIPRVVYVGVDSHIHELRLQKSWIQSDLSAIVTDNPPAVPAINGSSLYAYVTPDSIPRVLYVGVDSHIHELRLQGTNLTPVGWIQSDLSAIVTDNPPAVPAINGSSVHAYVTPDSIPRVVYVGVDSHVHELRLQGTNLTPVSWIQADLSAIVSDNPPAFPAVGDLFAYVTPDSVARVVYLGTDCHIREQRLQGTWIQADLSAIVTDNPPASPAAGCGLVTTYHNDSWRTGWNNQETILNPANVVPGKFGLIGSADLDDQVDAQPLILSGQTIGGKTFPSVAYVATETNTIYAIDASSGAVIKSNNLGQPVPASPSCPNNGPNIGIDGTPVIDLMTQTLYFITDNLMPGGEPAHQLHALDLATLQDRPGSPRVVAASAQLDDGSTTVFDSSVQRQRTALLLANGTIYAGFSSYCDHEVTQSRGWVLGWKESDLTPLASAEVVDKDTASQSNFLLSAVWMSGFGIAADPQGDLYFTTGNSKNYNSSFNLAESIVKLRSDLGAVDGFFTPSNEDQLDGGDLDFGSGGTLLLPDQPGPVPHLAVAGGKYGELFIVNRDDLGGASGSQSSVVIGPCWCGPSYYQGADNRGHVVSSGGGHPQAQGASVGPLNGPTIMQWTVDTTRTPALTMEASAPALYLSAHDGGIFTSISSNGETPNTAIIWAVDRPDSNNNVNLFAFDATPNGGVLTQLWSDQAGTWSDPNANPNIVPTISNGRVFVASDRELRIFGLVSPGQQMVKKVGPKVERAASVLATTGLTYWGTIRKVQGHRVTLELRSGKAIVVDISKVAPLAGSDSGAVGRRIAVNGTKDSNGVLVADGLWRVKAPETWGADSPN
jgi:hypothetical protein